MTFGYRLDSTSGFPRSLWLGDRVAWTGTQRLPWLGAGVLLIGAFSSLVCSRTRLLEVYQLQTRLPSCSALLLYFIVICGHIVNVSQSGIQTDHEPTNQLTN